MSAYRTTPEPTDRMPKGIPYIIGNEAAERFSYYGMRSILFVFMTKYILDAGGDPDLMSEAEATKWIHRFGAAVYITPLLGGLLADLFLGKYRTIILLSVVYCLGHLALALDDTRLGLAIGLGLIALGSGGIKPCVSAHVGDQFGRRNASLLPRVFTWFYFSINLGSFVATLLIPYLLKEYGPHVAFGVPGLLMLTATIVFWMGRRKFAHVPPDRQGFVTDLVEPHGRAALRRLSILYVFIAMFWALFDQTMSRWVGQAEHMRRTLFGVEWEASQFQAANPLFVMALIPVFSFLVYPVVGRHLRVTPLRKIGTGFFVAAAAFVIPAQVQSWIENGLTPSIGWQLLAYLIITAAEVLISITALEYSYAQTPRRLKSLVMGFYLLAVALGNLFVSEVNAHIERAGAPAWMEGAGYYWFFAACMLGTALLFTIVAPSFKERVYLQDDPEPRADASSAA
ncbi:N/A [soil metagenome]